MLIEDGNSGSLEVLGVSALALQFRGRFRLGGAVRILCGEQGLCFRLGFLQFFFRGGRNFVPVVMVVVAGPATNLCRLPVH